MRARAHICLLLLAAACSESHGPSQGATRLSGGAAASAIRDAAGEYGVRAEVLAAVPNLLGGLDGSHFSQDADGEHGRIGRWGLLQLTDPGIVEGAGLAGVTEPMARNDWRSNARAAAALLRARIERHESHDDDPPSWKAMLWAAADVGGFDPETAIGRDFAAELAHLLAQGFMAVTRDGEEIVVEPLADELGDLEGDESAPAASSRSLALTGEGYPPLEWVPAHANNYVLNRNGGSVRYILIHDTEITYWETLALFQTANASSASTQYVIRSRDGHIANMVDEAHGAYHAGNDYYSMQSVGIEHEGIAREPQNWFTEAMYHASARLVCAIAKRHGVPVDRQHIIAHAQVPNPTALPESSPPGTPAQVQASPTSYGGRRNKVDPGSGWDWTYYLGLVADCVAGDTATPCRSETLAQATPAGSCVQAAPTAKWYSCRGGLWILSGDQGRTEPEECSIRFSYCPSASLGRWVPARSCVQSKFNGNWYQCGENAGWQPLKNGVGPVGDCSMISPL